MDNLKEARKKINEIDAQMAKLFEERMKVSEDVALYKKEHALPIFDETREKEVIAKNVEFIEDAYLEILKAVDAGLIKIRRYEDMSDKMLDWIKTTIKKEYTDSENEPDYRYFLKAKFSFLTKL